MIFESQRRPFPHVPLYLVDSQKVDLWVGDLLLVAVGRCCGVVSCPPFLPPAGRPGEQALPGGRAAAAAVLLLLEASALQSSAWGK